MAVDGKFEIIRPTLDRLVRVTCEVANTALLNPQSTSPLALVDGELVQLTSLGKFQRATDATKPSFVSIEDRGDTGVQAARKLSAIMCGGGFQANTLIHASSGLGTPGIPLKYGSVTVEGLSRAGLVAHDSTNIVLGYLLKAAADNGGKGIQFIWTFA